MVWKVYLQSNAAAADDDSNDDNDDDAKREREERESGALFQICCLLLWPQSDDFWISQNLQLHNRLMKYSEYNITKFWVFNWSSLNQFVFYREKYADFHTLIVFIQSCLFFHKLQSWDCWKVFQWVKTSKEIIIFNCGMMYHALIFHTIITFENIRQVVQFSTCRREWFSTGSKLRLFVIICKVWIDSCRI